MHPTVEALTTVVIQSELENNHEVDEDSVEYSLIVGVMAASR